MKIVRTLMVLLLLAGCSTLQQIKLVPTNAPDMAQSIAAAQITYQGLASLALDFVNSGYATAAQKETINQANEVSHAAVEAAVTALEQCPVVGNKYDTVCSNSAAITASFATATSAIQTFTSLLQSNGVNVGSN